MKKGGMESPQEMDASPVTQRHQTTVIARGVKLEGSFVGQSDVHIEGEVEGHVKTSGALLVGSEAMITADVTADSATIAGTIRGTVTIKTKLQIKSTARITGDIVCETVAIEAGAVLSGKIQAGPTGSSQP